MNSFKSKIVMAITSLFLIITTLSIQTTPALAASSVIKGNIISGGGITSIYRNSPSWVWNLPGGMVSITVGGEIAYCLEPSRTVETKSATSIALNSLSQINVGPVSRPDAPKSNVTGTMKEHIVLIANYGFGYPGHNTVRYQWATQKLIWDTLGFDISGGTDVKAEEQAILALVNGLNKFGWLILLML